MKNQIIELFFNFERSVSTLIGPFQTSKIEKTLFISKTFRN